MCASNSAHQTNLPFVITCNPPESVLYLSIHLIKAGWIRSPVATGKMQTFTVIVLVTFLYYAPAIYKKIINNFKVSTIHP